MSKLIFDRENDVLVIENVGRTRTLTPEGFLFCEGVRIARTGPMLYAAMEVPDIDPGQNTMVVIERDADALFSADSIASFNGKPVTVGHPDEMVGPSTWRESAAGTVMNVRRGEGAEGEYLLADLLITDASAIEAVQGGLLQVSCGYDSDRVQVRPGLGRTTKVIGNHVALVEKGRCGPACSIQDSEVFAMAKRSVWDRLRTAFKAKDEAAFEEELKAAQDEGEAGEPGPPVVVHVHNAPGAEKAPSPAETTEKDEGPDDPMTAILAAIKDLQGRLSALEGKGKDEAPEADKTTEDEDPSEEDKKDGVTDSADLRDEFQDTLARAEVLAPGVKIPNFDAKAKRKLMVDAMCDLRKAAMRAALADPARKAHVETVLGSKPDVSKLTCDAAAMAFRAASELARAANNKAGNMPPPGPQAGRMSPVKYQEMIAARRKAGPRS